MTPLDKKRILRQNAILWISAMAIAPIFDLSFKAFASGPVKFPWVICVPLLMVGLLIASNNLLAKALGGTAEEGKA